MYTNEREYPCPICGGESYQWGKPNSSGGVWYAESVDPVAMFDDNKGLLARLCANCGNVQLFLRESVENEKPKRKRTESSAQPSWLNRPSEPND